MTQLSQGSADPETIVALLSISFGLLQEIKDSLTMGLNKIMVFDGKTIIPLILVYRRRPKRKRARGIFGF